MAMRIFASVPGIFVATLSLALVSTTAADPVPGPSYSCANVIDGGIEQMICNDAGLSMLDRKLAAVYSEALKIAATQQPPTLRAEQRGWIKGRDECGRTMRRVRAWKTSIGGASPSCRRCIACCRPRVRSLTSATAIRANEVVASYFATDPPTLVAEHGDSVSLMYLQPSGSGAKYAGRNETLWEHAGEATITWGYGAAAMTCTVQRLIAQRVPLVG